MATLKDDKFDVFMRLFNYEISDTMYSKEEIPISFNIMNGGFIKTYESSVSEKKMRKFSLDKISHSQVSKQMKIIGKEDLFDYSIIENSILSTFCVTQDRIFLKDINLNRDKNISTYSITADVYPEIYSVLKKPFSLEKLYYAFVAASEEEKKIIVDYFNSLKFKCVNNIKYNKVIKFANKEELKFLNLNKIYSDRLKEVLDEATKNSNIIELFNIDNPLLEIPSPVSPVSKAYTDDEISLQKKIKKKY